MGIDWVQGQGQNGYRDKDRMGIEWVQGQGQNGYSLGTEWVWIGYRDRDKMCTA